MLLFAYFSKISLHDSLLTPNNDLAQIEKAINFYKKLNNISVFEVFIYNLNYLLLYAYGVILNKICFFINDNKVKTRLSEHSSNIISQYRFYSLLYSIEKHRVHSAKDNLYNLLSEVLINQSMIFSYKINLINKITAAYIVENSKDFNVYQLKKLKKAYYKWVESLEKPNKNKYYLTKFSSTESDKYSLSNQEPEAKSQKLPKKNVNWQKKYSKITSYFVIFGSGIALGIIPAVLSAGAFGGVLSSLIVIGIPSVIINLIIYKYSVQSFIKDMLNDRLLKDENGKFIKLSIPLFIISLATGVIYASMVFVTSFIAVKALLFYLFPQVIISSLSFLIVGLAKFVAASFTLTTFISTVSLYFSSLVNELRYGVKKAFTEFINQKFLSVIKSNKTKQQKILSLIANTLFYLSLLAAALYLTFIETALLYSMAVILVPNPILVLGLVILSAPANLLFTFKIYTFLVNFTISVPNFFSTIKSNFYLIISNPILFYESIKASLKFIVLSLFIIDYAKGSAAGLVNELSTVSFFGVNLHMNSTFVSGITKLTEATDCVGVCLEGANEIYEPAVSNLVSGSQSLKNSC